ncbi:lytic transglycosylase domain-containing protein [Streptomyces lanatus]|uniref:Lytic transglycosylase domain-containing protein n=1 Tax=Streptomyces lanatus TaxID=66900 RepID=A0ABV1XZU1_9ACTN|nr:lytic transglycosylase domain-containing protein [Streptomyces lanatus]
MAAMVALTASGAPGTVPARASAPTPRQEPAEHGPSVSGDTPYRTDLPPLRTGKPDGDEAEEYGALPASVFAAYRRAEERLAREAPGCRLRWQLLAALGQVESGQARGERSEMGVPPDGVWGSVTPDGTTVTPILGPRLDGVAFALIRDTDGGAHDGDTVYDRAVGPMQFIPSTWARWGADGNGDGRTDPNNVFDAALAAGRYLCAGGRDLSVPAELDRAILGYNHSAAYLRTVRAWYAYFLDGHRVIPDASAGSSARPEPSSRSHPKPKKATRAPSAPASASPSRTQSPPAPSRPTAAPEESDSPQLPLPSPDIELPADDLLSVDAPLTSNSAESMTATPSTTADTER